jgi:hypothetical protein
MNAPSIPAIHPCPCPGNRKGVQPTCYQVTEHPRKQAGFYALCPVCSREVYARTPDNLTDFWNRSSQDVKATYAPVK